MSKYATLNDQDREQLRQLAQGHVWDGNLVSKKARDRLDQYGLVCRAEGFNFLTMAGIVAAVALGYLAP